MKKILWLATCLMFLLAGCSGEPKVNTYHVEGNQEEVKELEKAFAGHKEVESVSGVFFDHQLVVSMQVKPFSKFSKAKITKKMEKEVKSLFPEHDVAVFSDLKITWELDKIIKEEPGKKQVKKDLKKIQNLAKEET